MDVSFVTGKEKFNYRVCALLLHEGKILAMQDERSPYYYLPGGRVRMGETARADVPDAGKVNVRARRAGKQAVAKR